MRRASDLMLALAGVSVLILAGVQTANAMAGEYGKGDPKHPISNSSWPKGLDVVANRVVRIVSYWVNSSDMFYYAGDASDFNNFLKEYSRVESKSLTLDIDNSPGQIGLFQPIDASANWQMGSTGWSMANATVTMPLNGRIALKYMKVPHYRLNYPAHLGMEPSVSMDNPNDLPKRWQDLPMLRKLNRLFDVYRPGSPRTR